jgi:hypothetical protein
MSECDYVLFTSSHEAVKPHVVFLVSFVIYRNMWNRNTGECMDFTRFPRRNLSPGQHNFDRLYHLYGSVPLKRQTNLRHHVPAHRSLSQGTIAEYEKSILVALEDSSCMECRIGLSNGFQVTIHKLPLLVGMDPVKHQR